MHTTTFSSYAPVVLRLGLVAVYAWFGISQILHPAMWAGMVPGWAGNLSGLSPLTIVLLNGWFEVCAAILLGIGVYVRPIAILLFVHLFVITSHLGIGPIGVRDFGLSFATLAVGLFGEDHCCFSYHRRTQDA